MASSVDMSDDPRDSEPTGDDTDVERFEINGLVIERRGAQILFSAGPDFDPEALRHEFVEAGSRAAERGDEIIDRLIELLSDLNPVHLVGQVAALAMAGVLGLDDSGEKYGSEAQAEYLGGLALAIEAPGVELARSYQVWEAQDLLSELFDLERARIMAEESDGSSGDPVASARFILRHEEFAARTQGYVPHLRSIVERIFEPLRSECIEQIGFSPADIPTLVAAIMASAQSRFRQLIEQTREIRCR